GPGGDGEHGRGGWLARQQQLGFCASRIPDRRDRSRVIEIVGVEALRPTYESGDIDVRLDPLGRIQGLARAAGTEWSTRGTHVLAGPAIERVIGYRALTAIGCVTVAVVPSSIATKRARTSRTSRRGMGSAGALSPADPTIVDISSERRLAPIEI